MDIPPIKAAIKQYLATLDNNDCGGEASSRETAETELNDFVEYLERTVPLFVVEALRAQVLDLENEVRMLRAADAVRIHHSADNEI